MKKYALALLSISLLFLLAGCANNEPAAIKATMSYWSGWSIDYEPPQEEYRFEVARGDSFEAKSVVRDYAYTFTLLDVAEGSVTVRVSEPMSGNGDGTINLGSTQTDFAIQRGEVLELISLSTDEGDVIIFELY